MEEIQTMVQQVDLEKFADFRDTAISVLNNRLRDSEQFKKSSDSINNFKNIKDAFNKIKEQS